MSPFQPSDSATNDARDWQRDQDAAEDQEQAQHGPLWAVAKAKATPRTLACWRNGQWQVDELANTSDKLERELIAQTARYERALEALEVATAALKRIGTPALGGKAQQADAQAATAHIADILTKP